MPMAYIVANYRSISDQRKFAAYAGSHDETVSGLVFSFPYSSADAAGACRLQRETLPSVSGGCRRQQNV
jgi:hypothetical protein